MALIIYCDFGLKNHIPEKKFKKLFLKEDFVLPTYLEKLFLVEKPAYRGCVLQLLPRTLRDISWIGESAGVAKVLYTTMIKLFTRVFVQKKSENSYFTNQKFFIPPHQFVISYRKCQTTPPRNQIDGQSEPSHFFQIKHTLWKHVNFYRIKPLISIDFRYFFRADLYKHYFYFHGALIERNKKMTIHIIEEMLVKNNISNCRKNLKTIQILSVQENL